MKSQRGRITTNVLLILALAAVCALMFMTFRGEFKNNGTTTAFDSPTLSQNTQTLQKKLPSGDFTDGLGEPDTITRGILDEIGAGTESIAEFNRDINNDGKLDRITRTHVATGNAHDYEEYKIEINNNGTMQDITPNGFRTTHGADCALRLIQFHFKPTFGATVISRPFKDTWNTPSTATKTTYNLSNNNMTNRSAIKLKDVCDVRDLF